MAIILNGMNGVTISSSAITATNVNPYSVAGQTPLERAILDAMEILTGEDVPEPDRNVGGWETAFVKNFMDTLETFRNDYLELEKEYDTLRSR